MGGAFRRNCEQTDVHRLKLCELELSLGRTRRRSSLGGGDTELQHEPTIRDVGRRCGSWTKLTVVLETPSRFGGAIDARTTFSPGSWATSAQPFCLKIGRMFFRGRGVARPVSP